MELADVPRHRPLAFDKMENLIKEMQDPENGVPVRSQKLFLTFIPSAFMGYYLIEWLMERFGLEESVEALNLANQLCQYGYFFPVNDTKNLTIKDDSSLYRFQSPYYWPWQQRGAGSSNTASAQALPNTDNVEYAIYLYKRTLRNKQRHGLEEYELEALANLRKNLQAKWDFITMQAEEQVRLAKERKKVDKIVSDSQERAYWRVCRPPPGFQSALEARPVPVRGQARSRRRTTDQLKREIELLKASLDRTRVKVSVALEALIAYTETFAQWDPCLVPPQPSNPWVSDDIFYWQINSALVDVPTEKRVQRWAVSMEELVADPTGLQEFTSFLRKEYSHENIRFWLAVTDLRRSAQRQIQRKLNDIYEKWSQSYKYSGNMRTMMTRKKEASGSTGCLFIGATWSREFLKEGAPCEINIDGATMERVAAGLRAPSRFALDAAAEHVYALLLKKDCYPRFVRSDHYRMLLAAGKNTHHKKRFFGFGGQVKKKTPSCGGGTTGGGALGRRRGSDRSLSGSAHELAVSGVAPPPPRVPHSHSQSNLTEIPFREPADEDTFEGAPWEPSGASTRRRKDSAADSGSSSSDVSGACAVERARRVLPQQSTLDGGLRGAPPPLRRLSAVEPRHLVPLPPAEPPARTKNASFLSKSLSVHTAQTAPIISVISAPEDVESSESLTEASDSQPEKSETASVACQPPAYTERASEAPERTPISISEPAPPDAPEPPRAASFEAVPEVAHHIAPLAECEDTAVDEDNVDKVPLVPLPNVSEFTDNTPKPDVNINIAHKDERSSENESNYVKTDNNRDNASELAVQQNDVCPWEDEDTCKADAPFVKTYATLGYL